MLLTRFLSWYISSHVLLHSMQLAFMVEMVHALLFFFFVCSQPNHEFIKIDLVSVKFGAVYAGEFFFSTYCYPAATAHAGSIDHDGVKAYHGLDVQLAGHIADRFHHGYRSDGHYQVNLLRVDYFL